MLYFLIKIPLVAICLLALAWGVTQLPPLLLALILFIAAGWMGARLGK